VNLDERNAKHGQEVGEEDAYTLQAVRRAQLPHKGQEMQPLRIRQELKDQDIHLAQEEIDFFQILYGLFLELNLYI
jgi:hypothetical protein